MARRPPAAAPPPPLARFVALYERVSTREQQKEGYSLAAQDAALRDYAGRNGLQIAAAFVDLESGRKTGRKQFNELLRWLKKQPVGRRVVITEKTDSMYRNLQDYVVLDELVVELHLVKEGVVISEHSKLAEKFMHGIKVLMAKNYSDSLSEEVKKGMYQKAGEGQYPGRAPLGYLNQRTDGKRRLVLDPERALLVRPLFELYDAGTHSLTDLATYARGSGLRTRSSGVLAVSSIHLMLHNPLYGGWFMWGVKVFWSTDPLIVTAELCKRVRDHLNDKPMTGPVQSTEPLASCAFSRYVNPQNVRFTLGQYSLTPGHRAYTARDRSVAPAASTKRSHRRARSSSRSPPQWARPTRRGGLGRAPPTTSSLAD